MSIRRTKKELMEGSYYLTLAVQHYIIIREGGTSFTGSKAREHNQDSN